MESQMGVMEGLSQGLVGYGLTIVVALTAACMIWVIVRALEALQKQPEAPSAPAAVSVAVTPQPTIEDETPRHVAAIAAAVYTAVGAHRLVYVGEAATGRSWTATGRTLHQTSHMPKRMPQG